MYIDVTFAIYNFNNIDFINSAKTESHKNNQSINKC